MIQFSFTAILTYWKQWSSPLLQWTLEPDDSNNLITTDDIARDIKTLLDDSIMNNEQIRGKIVITVEVRNDK